MLSFGQKIVIDAKKQIKEKKEQSVESFKKL